jgi:mono/diheme cytochrome c family protein
MEKMIFKTIILFLLIAVLPACENIDMDLYDQVSFRTQESPRLINPAGSVPAFGAKIDYAEIDPARLESPFKFDEETAQRGKVVYDIFCSLCHGKTGEANTKVAEKMDITPFDISGESSAELTDGEIFVKILASESIMPNYRSELTDKEAWEITSYVRALQERMH